MSKDSGSDVDDEAAKKKSDEGGSATEVPVRSFSQCPCMVESPIVP